MSTPWTPTAKKLKALHSLLSPARTRSAAACQASVGDPSVIRKTQGL